MFDYEGLLEQLEIIEEIEELKEKLNDDDIIGYLAYINYHKLSKPRKINYKPN